LGAGEGVVEATPFNRDGRVPSELKKTREHHRTRRLAAGEEARLLAAAEPHLKDYMWLRSKPG
jgi:hypothetical protein